MITCDAQRLPHIWGRAPLQPPVLRIYETVCEHLPSTHALVVTLSWNESIITTPPRMLSAASHIFSKPFCNPGVGGEAWQLPRTAARDSHTHTAHQPPTPKVSRSRPTNSRVSFSPKPREGSRRAPRHVKSLFNGFFPGAEIVFRVFCLSREKTTDVIFAFFSPFLQPANQAV